MALDGEGPIVVAITTTTVIPPLTTTALEKYALAPAVSLKMRPLMVPVVHREEIDFCAQVAVTEVEVCRRTHREERTVPLLANHPLSFDAVHLEKEESRKITPMLLLLLQGRSVDARNHPMLPY